MLFFVADSFELGDLEKSEDVLDRTIMSIEELLEKYYGDKELLRSIINEAQKILQ